MSFSVDKDVPVPMRDGTVLAADVWRPRGEGPWPTLMVRTVYGKDSAGLYGQGTSPNPSVLVEAGYAVVFQDCRGRGRSEGTFAPMANEPDDGADTVAWLIDQPWCDGNIGAYGPSYPGLTQWAAAAAGAKGLRAIAPAFTTTDGYTAPWYSPGGALCLHTTYLWAAGMALSGGARTAGPGSGPDPADQGALVSVLADPVPHLEHLPVADAPLLERYMPWWSEVVAHPARDAYWRGLSVAEDFSSVTVPALNIGGWYDAFLGSTLTTFTALRRRAGTPEARGGQRLVVGPWDHLYLSGAYPDRQFGLTADSGMCDMTGQHLAFFDRWLRDRPIAADGSGDGPAVECPTAPVRIFVMGIDQWRDEQDWPLPDTRYTDYFLTGSGRGANTAEGDGLLTTEPPTVEHRDTYLYDPRRPVPTLGGRMLQAAAARGAGPVDQRPVETRDDVLCYTTPVLTEPLEVTGPVSLVLHVTSSARDTDFTGKLVDVHPDGRAIILTEGIVRARYRNSLAEPELMAPGEVYEISLDLCATANVFRPGHRIRLEVSSSNFPRYDRNTNTGGVVAQDGEGDLVVAVNQILHGPAHPSRLVLPVIDRS